MLTQITVHECLVAGGGYYVVPLKLQLHFCVEMIVLILRMVISFLVLTILIGSLQGNWERNLK